MADGFKISELAPCQCRFAISPFHAVSHRFCGAPVKDPLKPWCAEHWPRVFDQRSLAQIKRDGQEAIEKFNRNKFKA